MAQHIIRALPLVLESIATRPRLMMAEIGDSATPQPPDAELVARARRDDRAAIELLARRHYRAAFSVALAILSNWPDAEDVTQDALIRALAHLEDCREPDRFAQWTCTIARNLALNSVKHPYARKREALDPRTPVKESGAVLRAERRDLQRAIEVALQGLPQLQREVVLLHDLHDWSHDMIADHLGTSAGMSRQHLFRGRRHLRRALGPDLLREYFNE